MDHPRFVEGAITTAFIAEEYPEGFAGALLPAEMLRRVAALAAHMHSVRETRAAQIFGAIQNHGRKVGRDWVVLIDRAPWPLSRPARRHAQHRAASRTGARSRSITDWHPGQSLVRREIDGERAGGAGAADRGGLARAPPRGGSARLPCCRRGRRSSRR